MENLIRIIQKANPDFIFKPGKQFAWSPSSHAITYDNENDNSSHAAWGLLHELSHALLKHESYSSDFELLVLEADAWNFAKKLGKRYGYAIDDDHIQNCLDTYREWLHRRSTCPSCGNRSIQQNICNYSCFNCNTSWQVTASRFCRPYRLVAKEIKKSHSNPKVRATFQ